MGDGSFVFRFVLIFLSFFLLFLSSDQLNFLSFYLFIFLSFSSFPLHHEARSVQPLEERR